jgi:hypothetical protein
MGSLASVAEADVGGSIAPPSAKQTGVAAQDVAPGRIFAPRGRDQLAATSAASLRKTINPAPSFADLA